MATGVDLSEHDVRRHPGGIDRHFMAGFEFVIVRVANENGYPDRYAEHLVAEAKACGRPWGTYAWPVVGWGLEQNRVHAGALVTRYGTGTLGLAADAEHSKRGFASPVEVEGFCIGAREAGAPITPYYCTIDELYRTPYLDGLPWWMADYTYNTGAYFPPELREPYPPPDRPWTIHQFTSMGWPGGGSLDVNYAPSLDFAGGAPASHLPPEDQMFVVVNRDTGRHDLYTALGTTEGISETLSNELAFAKVPRYDLPGNVVTDVALIHAAHRQAFGAPADSDPCPPGLADASDAALLAELASRLQ